PIDFSNFIINRLGVDTLTLELLAGPTYELMKGSYYGHIKWIKDLVPRTMWIQEPLNYDKNVLWGVSHWGRKRQQFYGFAVNRESALDVYSKRRIIAIYKFKEGDFKRLRLQDIVDMLLLLVQGKLSNLTIEERFAFNASLRMFTRSIVIQRRVEDLQLGVESYQKRLNLTKPDTYRSDLKRREAYTAYSNPRGFIYQNRDKKNRLMRIDKLHKFSDGTLNDVRNALDDRLKGIRMQEMLHISPRVPDQSFAKLPFEEEILEFLRFLGHSAQIKILTDVNVNKLYQPWRSFAVVINKCPTGKSTGFDSLRNLQSLDETELTGITSGMIFCSLQSMWSTMLATEEAAPKPKASARKKKSCSAASTTSPTPIANPTPTKTVVAAPRLSAAAKGKQPARARSPTKPLDVERTEAEQLKIILRRSRHEMHISQQGGSGTDEGTGSKPGVLNVPSDDSEEELLWNSSDDEDVDTQTQGRDKSEGEKTDESDDDDDAQEEAKKVNDDDDNEEEVPKIDKQETTESDEGDDEATESDRESEDEETREHEEESFDPIPRTAEESKDDDNNEEDQGLRIGEEERMHEEEEADELYRDSDAQQESSSTSSFMTNLLNPLIDPGMEPIFMTGSTTVTPIPSPQSTMTPSIISTFTTASKLPTHPIQIPSLDLQSLPTFASVFRFEDRVKLLEVNFSNLPGIVNQYMHQQMPEAVREAVQTQTDRL
nr:hypothetical protein [Tanacetum cinerariifolium]